MASKVALPPASLTASVVHSAFVSPAATVQDICTGVLPAVEATRLITTVSAASVELAT